MSWLDTITKVAPVVASALGGPLAGVAVTALGELFGISEPTQSKIQAVIENGQLTGEQISAIRQLELKLKADEAERGFRYKELEFKDSDSARQMQMTTHSKTPSLLTGILTVGFFGTLYMVMIHPEMKESAPLMIMLGALGAEFTSACKFWFGANSGSDRTKELLASSTQPK